MIKGDDGNPIRLGVTDGLYNHGYAIIDLDGASGKVSYYQDSDEDNADVRAVDALASRGVEESTRLGFALARLLNILAFSTSRRLRSE